MTEGEEFRRIARHFAPLAGPEALGLLDDAAVLDPPPGRALVLTSDAIVAGVHFLPDDPVELIARKLLRVNLSDLAAMGAEPYGYLLTVGVPADTPESWFAAFASGLAEDGARFGCRLLGGDTVSTPGPVTLSATLLGLCVTGAALRRSGARPGDRLLVTGTIGDGALGLLARRGQLADAGGALERRYLLPEPRLGLARADLVSACMDISDGLVQDAGHLCRASGVSAVIEAARVPASAAASALGPAYLETRLTGGDDYELLLTVAPPDIAALTRHADGLGVALTEIGEVRAGDSGVSVLGEGGRALSFARPGWSHL